jgi:hypothetical protein
MRFFDFSLQYTGLSLRLSLSLCLSLNLSLSLSLCLRLCLSLCLSLNLSLNLSLSLCLRLCLSLSLKLSLRLSLCLSLLCGSSSIFSLRERDFWIQRIKLPLVIFKKFFSKNLFVLCSGLIPRRVDTETFFHFFYLKIPRTIFGSLPNYALSISAWRSGSG